MFEITGKYATAHVMTDAVDAGILSQLYHMINSPGINNTVVIMPDVHVGIGSVVGFTMPYTDRVVPNVVGVDIGCGVLTVELATELSDLPDITLSQIDTAIRSVVPTGMHVNTTPKHRITDKDTLDMFARIGIDPHYANCSLGTLGSGNHFIEIGICHDTDTHYVTIHTGSRNVGVKVCKYHQDIAQRTIKQAADTTAAQIAALKARHANHELTGPQLHVAIIELKSNHSPTPDDLAYLTGDALALYIHDMHITQAYAAKNRQMIADAILTALGVEGGAAFESVHNYIDHRDNIIRKGAISAHPNERLVIPINRTFGTIVGTALGSAHWNYSAPHGAGRTMSRSEAKDLISQTAATARMVNAGIYSLVDPPDEDDAAYKSPPHILAAIEKTARIDFVIRPIINIK